MGFAAVQVALLFNSLMIFTFMHSGILKSGKVYVSEAEEAEFMSRAISFAKNLGYEVWVIVYMPVYIHHVDLRVSGCKVARGAAKLICCVKWGMSVRIIIRKVFRCAFHLHSIMQYAYVH